MGGYVKVKRMTCFPYSDSELVADSPDCETSDDVNNEQPASQQQTNICCRILVVDLPDCETSNINNKQPKDC